MADVIYYSLWLPCWSNLRTLYYLELCAKKQKKTNKLNVHLLNYAIFITVATASLGLDSRMQLWTIYH